MNFYCKLCAIEFLYSILWIILSDGLFMSMKTITPKDSFVAIFRGLLPFWQILCMSSSQYYLPKLCHILFYGTSFYILFLCFLAVFFAVFLCICFWTCLLAVFLTFFLAIFCLLSFCLILAATFFLFCWFIAYLFFVCCRLAARFVVLYLCCCSCQSYCSNNW